MNKMKIFLAYIKSKWVVICMMLSAIGLLLSSLARKDNGKVLEVLSRELNSADEKVNRRVKAINKKADKSRKKIEALRGQDLDSVVDSFNLTARLLKSIAER